MLRRCTSRRCIKCRIECWPLCCGRRKCAPRWNWGHTRLGHTPWAPRLIIFVIGSIALFSKSLRAPTSCAEFSHFTASWAFAIRLTSVGSMHRSRITVGKHGAVPLLRPHFFSDQLYFFLTIPLWKFTRPRLTPCSIGAQGMYTAL